MTAPDVPPYRRLHLAFAVPPYPPDYNPSLWNQRAVVVVGALMFLVIFVLGLIPIAKCAFRLLGFESPTEIQSRLANTGLKHKVLQSLPTIVYGQPQSVIMQASSTASDCPICLAQFADGEKLRVLPPCHHGFHVRCIDTWLLGHSSCPICRHSLLN